MSDTTTDAAITALKKAALTAKITSLNNTLSKVNTQITSLTTERTNLNTSLGEWETQKTSYDNSDIVSEVVIVNEFEGVCADKIKTDLGDCVAAMEQTYSSVNDLKGNVSSQISSLNTYKTSLSTQIISLTNELNSL